MNRKINRVFSVITILALLLMALPMRSAGAVSNTIVISQVYGAGGNAGAVLRNDYVELFNRGTTTVSLTGWSVQYASATGTGNFGGNPVATLSGSLAPGQYYLVQLASGGANGALLPTADATGTANMSGTGGKVVLVNSTTGLACNGGSTVCSAAQLAQIVDLVGWDGANFYETAPAPATTTTTSVSRNSNGCTETDNNASDFTAGAPSPRNTASPFNPCPTGVTLSINDVSANEGDSGTTSFDFTVSLSGPAGPGGVTFDIATADGTAQDDNPATEDNDYVAQSLTGQTISEGSSGPYNFNVTVNGDTSAESNETFSVTVTNVTGATLSDGQGVGTIVNDDVAIAFIHDVQGSGSAVTGPGPFTVEAIVVGDFQSSDQLRGFFIQEEDVNTDTDSATSEGIFVFCSNCPTGVSVGDKVRVTGGASEFSGLSQLSATSAGSIVVISPGNPLPTPASIDLPASGSTRSASTFENIESMLVTFADTLYVSEYFELARFGQLVLTADARPAQFTDANEPSVSGYAAFLNDLNRRRIFLDDDNNIQNDALGGFEGDTPALDEPYFWPRPGLSNTNLIRGGDSITNMTGVIHWSANAWRVRPVEPAFSYVFTSNNERTATPEDVGGSLKVASFNVLNYFTTINSRGADSTAELDRQRAKTTAAICAMNVDVVGLIEIENNAGVAIDDLLNGLGGINDVCGTYEYIDTGILGTDEIIQAFIYRPASVSPVGDYAVLDSSVDPRFDEDRNRPALAQTFQDNTTGGIFTVVVNHLKSKGSACPGDPDILDGQGNCNITRREAAAAMVDWLATDPTGSGDEDFLIMGDLNSYRNEDPIDSIEAGTDDTAGTADDFTDLLDALNGASAYSYVFDGQLGYLDTGLASSELLDEVTGITEWHINADEVPVFDYNDEILDGNNEDFFERESTSLQIYEANQYRSSDHDPILVGLDVCDEIAPAFDVLSVTPNVLWPANHKYVDVTATVMVSDNFDPNPTITLVSVTSNEPDDGEDDGNTVDDIVIVDDFHFKLRAERSGIGTGRVYTITYMVTDACSNSTTQSITVAVPLSQGD